MISSPVASLKRTHSIATPDLTSPLSLRTAPPSQSSKILINLKREPSAKQHIEPKAARYRDARALPYELRHHCLVYLEEQLYSSALSLLNNLLISGQSYPVPASPAFAPPPSHIALTSTLLVHPLHTTRNSTFERFGVSSEALILLRNTLNILGPVNASLNEAFRFRSGGSGTPWRSRTSSRRSDGRNGSFDEDEVISSVLAEEDSLWTRGRDFWHVVGWAFNCSVKNRTRWDYWKVWMEYMLEVLDADWNERELLEKKRRNGSPGQQTRLEDCLLLRYVLESGTSSTAIKRTVKAAFADGSVDASRAYPEVFEHEGRKQNNQVGMERKRAVKVDLDEDNYGDYMSDEQSSDEGDSTLLPSSPTAGEDSDEEPALQDLFGGREAIILRLRILALLSRASHTFPDTYVPIPTLYSIFYEVIHSLPLPAFHAFMSASAAPHLPPAALSSLAQVHLLRLLPNSAPVPSTDELTQDTLERCFLPFAAHNSSVEDNSKVSILTETLLRLFVGGCEVNNLGRLEKSVERGIVAREGKCFGDRGRRKKGVGGREAVWLRESAGRMRMLMKVLKARKGSR